MGVFSIYADCGCKGDAENCSCIECDCPSRSDREQTEEQKNYLE